jgi:hypothetical protein
MWPETYEKEYILKIVCSFYEYISRKWNKGVIWDFLGNVFSNSVGH